MSARGAVTITRRKCTRHAFGHRHLIAHARPSEFAASVLFKPVFGVSCFVFGWYGLCCCADKFQIYFERCKHQTCKYDKEKNCTTTNIRTNTHTPCARSHIMQHKCLSHVCAHARLFAIRRTSRPGDTPHATAKHLFPQTRATPRVQHVHTCV